jgi:hypothetical protein
VTSANQPNCYRCRHFRITHNPQWPYGCEFFGMRSKGLPSSEVLRSSGQVCGAFEEKERPRKREGREGCWG